MLRVLAILLALTGSAFAQTRPPENPTAPTQPNYPLQRLCMAQNGSAVPCALTDVPQPDVTTSFQPPQAWQKAGVVSISPNSGSGSGYPSASTPVTAHQTGTTGAVAATLAAVPGYTNYVCGISASPGSATTAIDITEVLSGTLGGSMTWTVGAPATAAGATGSTFTVAFTPCVPASGVNTAIVLTQGALGTGGAGASTQLWGYYK